MLAAAKAGSYTRANLDDCQKDRPVKFKPLMIAASLPLLALGACAKDGDFDSTGGINVTRSACPAVAVPAYTGDVTLFNPADSRDSRAIDVVANITNLKTVCGESGADMVANTSFDVLARRSDARGAREVILPYFATVVQGGKTVVSKRIASVLIRFEDGKYRASTTGKAAAVVNKAAATLSPDIQRQITRKRKAGDADAALDPMADPAVKAALAQASFELLVGFQLNPTQLQYNATR